MRKPIIVGNWKMNKTHLEAITLVRALSYELRDTDYHRADVAVCPPFTSLRTIQLVLEEEHIPIALGAQDVHWESAGAYTGEVSPGMLKALHCSYVIVGHSERRAIFSEADEAVNRKVRAVFGEGMTPILCVGETLERRDAGATGDVIERQVRAGVDGLTPSQRAELVVAYEPVWAIGSGRAATPEDANEVCGLIRRLTTDDTRVQYGGSVSPGNIAQFMAQEHVDGALVGGAALEAKSFAMIVRY